MQTGSKRLTQVTALGILSWLFFADTCSAASHVVAWGGAANGSTLTNFNDVTAISAGSGHNFGLLDGGTIFGRSALNQTPLSIPPGLSNVVAINVSPFSGELGGIGLVLKSNRTVASLKGAFFSYDLVTPPVPEGLSNVVAFAPGMDHAMAVKSDGKVIAWGGNSYGQASVPAGLSNVVAVAAGRL